MTVEILRPDAAGDLEYIRSGTPYDKPYHYLNVNEVVADGDTSMVYEIGDTGPGSTQSYDLYNIPNSGINPGLFVINKITVYARCRQGVPTFPFTGAMRNVLKTGGTQYESGYKSVTSQLYSNFSEEWTINPKTGVAWTWVDINALQIGIMLKGNRSSGYLSDTYCTQVWVEITYGEAPTVTTQAVRAIAKTTALGNGTIVSFGAGSIPAHGVCWNTTGSPTIADSLTDLGATSSIGAFVSEITGLIVDITYYVRAYGTHESGTNYGEEVSFIAGGPPNYWYHLNVKNINLPYVDLDGTKELHLILKNLSPTMKLSGEYGKVKVKVDYEPAA